MSIPILIVWGRRRKHDLIAAIPYDCPECDRRTTHVYGKVIDSFTLFFIPVRTLERRQFLQCSECRLEREPWGKERSQVRLLAEFGEAPFRICPQCGTHNDPSAALCESCKEVLRATYFPRKGAARVVAITMTVLFVCFVLAVCVALYLAYV